MSTARELRAVWAIVAVTALATCVTYVRLPADELYRVKRQRPTKLWFSQRAPAEQPAHSRDDLVAVP